MVTMLFIFKSFYPKCKLTNTIQKTWKNIKKSNKIKIALQKANVNIEALYSQQKYDQELTVAQTMNSLLPNSDLNWRK